MFLLYYCTILGKRHQKSSGDLSAERDTYSEEIQSAYNIEEVQHYIVVIIELSEYYTEYVGGDVVSGQDSSFAHLEFCAYRPEDTTEGYCLVGGDELVESEDSEGDANTSASDAIQGRVVCREGEIRGCLRGDADGDEIGSLLQVYESWLSLYDWLHLVVF